MIFFVNGFLWVQTDNEAIGRTKHFNSRPDQCNRITGARRLYGISCSAALIREFCATRRIRFFVSDLFQKRPSWRGAAVAGPFCLQKNRVCWRARGARARTLFSNKKRRERKKKTKKGSVKPTSRGEQNIFERVLARSGRRRRQRAGFPDEGRLPAGERHLHARLPRLFFVKFGSVRQHNT